MIFVIEFSKEVAETFGLQFGSAIFGIDRMSGKISK